MCITSKYLSNYKHNLSVYAYRKPHINRIPITFSFKIQTERRSIFSVGINN